MKSRYSASQMVAMAKKGTFTYDTIETFKRTEKNVDGIIIFEKRDGTSGMFASKHGKNLFNYNNCVASIAKKLKCDPYGLRK